MRFKKYFIIFCLIFLLSGCSLKDNSVVKLYVTSGEDSFQLEDIVIEVVSLDNECVSNMNCAEDDEVNMKVMIGFENELKEYTLSTVGKKVVIKEVGRSFGLSINDGHLAIDVYEK